MLSVLLLAGCAETAAVTEVRVPAAVAAGRVVIDLPVGHKAGAYEWGWGCDGPYHDVAWIAEGGIDRILADALRDGAGWGGLSLTPGAGRVLSGRLVDIDLSLCRRMSGDTRRSVGTTGTGRVRIDWEVTDPPRAVHRFTTEGTGESDVPSLNGKYGIIIRNAMADATRRLATLPEFRYLALSSPATGTAVSAAPSPALASIGAAPTLPTAVQPTVEVTAPHQTQDIADEGDGASQSAALIRWGSLTGVIADPGGLVLLPDTGANLPTPVPLMLADGRVVDSEVAAQAFGFILLRLPAGLWPAITIRRQRPGVSQFLYRPGDDGSSAAMVAAHIGPARSQGTEVPSLLLDLDTAVWRDPPWMLVDEEGRLAALRGQRTLPGDPAPYYAPAGVMAHFRTITPPTATDATAP
ncbi:hypothetical protein CHU95_09090 [Niveispirillum lacus]|uniref:Uncharacterized protein n=2 Tax=Niveispirillum lacus TaxID=1981099 RepID=A0A255Z1M2_9PROT|nr:hypothetical protein CHU95_09090 [Niveispirillum lacus]